MEPHSRRRHGTLLLPQALILFLRSCFADSPGLAVTQSHTDIPYSGWWETIKRRLFQRLLHVLSFIDSRESIFVGMVKLTAICGIGIGSALWIWSNHSKEKKTSRSVSGSRKSVSDVSSDEDATATDPGLLKKHSTVRAYKVPRTGFTYPAIRTFYRPHSQEKKLPSKPNPVPLLVFIHGLGGSAAQFHPILVSLVNLAPCLAIDLPGCGVSSFEPKDWNAYTTEALVHLLAVIIEAHRDRDGGQGVVLIGHSMGCSLAALLASSSSPYADLISEHINGLIAVCPNAEPPTKRQCKSINLVTSIPGPIFELMRKLDRRGGVNSKSVERMAGPNAEEETKKLQLRFNEQSQTPVWQRMARGMIPDYSMGTPQGGLPGKEVWSGLQLPVFLAAGDADNITPTHNVEKIVRFLGRDMSAIERRKEPVSLPIAAIPIDPATIDPAIAERKHQDSGVDARDLPQLLDDNTVPASSTASSTGESLVNADTTSSTGESATIAETSASTNLVSPASELPPPYPRRLVIKTTILPKPAAHALLFAPSSSRTLAGLIGTFLADHVDPRLSLGWQLQYLTAGGKWDVKNLEKWRAVQPVSLPIANVFRAMKTLREVDEHHAPKIFVKEWAGKIRAIVDISHDSPVYDPKGIEDGGIEYHKFPTVSKLPPTVDEVRQFTALIDKIRAELKQGVGAGEQAQALIGVHCHYGFNRTGFFVVSYLVERLGYKVEEAIDLFATARQPGIRHEHFINELHVRYCVGLKKAPTL
ncbi:uncharacterized protein BDR25DRAFT_289205 [Lindgomyces ingoldianus]|uniref:Uncharacterized protein n=1 Tax=Lindgomyces ingoldianus TaxID=673940 RepID=A0ACB6QPT5_9PLEO|nr:uncharacterized protein BDR25DRAFT_289205 [Lindgomyces ingoldianus]KAF2469039.1 hypothetical protein BDR25DRAFT_289205 [Lindgomyces ingoldianus]